MIHGMVMIDDHVCYYYCAVVVAQVLSPQRKSSDYGVLYYYSVCRGHRRHEVQVPDDLARRGSLQPVPYLQLAPSHSIMIPFPCLSLPGGAGLLRERRSTGTWSCRGHPCGVKVSRVHTLGSALDVGDESRLDGSPAARAVPGTRPVFGGPARRRVSDTFPRRTFDTQEKGEAISFRITRYTLSKPASRTNHVRPVRRGRRREESISDKNSPPSGGGIIRVLYVLSSTWWM